MIQLLCLIAAAAAAVSYGFCTCAVSLIFHNILLVVCDALG